MSAWVNIVIQENISLKYIAFGFIMQISSQRFLSKKAEGSDDMEKRPT